MEKIRRDLENKISKFVKGLQKKTSANNRRISIQSKSCSSVNLTMPTRYFPALDIGSRHPNMLEADRLNIKISVTYSSSDESESAGILTSSSTVVSCTNIR